jgi:DNA-binding MarR family transcriptional regulator
MSYLNSIYRADIPARAKAVFMYLRGRSDKDGGCWPSVGTISSELSLSRSTVKRALADLKKAGFLRAEPRYRENGSRSSNLYVTLDGCDGVGG